VLATSIVGVLLSLVQKHRRLISVQQAEVQAEWLAESGIDRAVFRLRSDRAYQGEKWVIGATELAGESPAEVVIDIQKQTDRGNGYIVQVKAVYRSDSGPMVRRTRQTTIELPQES